MLLTLLFDVLPRLPRVEAALYNLVGLTVEAVSELFDEEDDDGDA